MPFHSLIVARQVDFSNEIPDQFTLLPAVAAGLIRHTDDDLLYKLIDAIFYCLYDIHKLLTEEYLSKILWELNEEHKELLFSALSDCSALQGLLKYGIKVAAIFARCVVSGPCAISRMTG